MIKLGKEIPIGRSFLIYGPTGCGKTLSALTCEQPILFINTEGKDPRVVHQDYMKTNDISVDIDYIVPESFDDIVSFLDECITNAQNGDFRYKTIFFDGLTFGQTNLILEVEDSRRLVRKATKGEYRGLVDYARFERPDWGLLNSLMVRICNLLKKLSSMFGIDTISTAIDSDAVNKRYGGKYQIAPYLQGIAFPKTIHGLFDYIGYIVSGPMLSEDGKVIRPRISFVELEGDEIVFLCRNSSNNLAKVIYEKGPVPLDFQLIKKIITGGK